jgi:putative transposase
MKFNRDKYHRRSIRLKEYDYAQCGTYFVTICTQHRECLFGDIVDGGMQLNEFGEIVRDECLKGIQEHFNNVSLDEYMVMPNHVHKIIIINSNCRGEVASPSLKTRNPLTKGGETPPLCHPTLGQIVAYYKYQSTKYINHIRNHPGMPVWQRNYYEHVIRNESEFHRIREYIINNPLHWDDDENNPANYRKADF